MAFIVSACASLPPAKSVKNMSEIAGKWEGTGTGPGGAVLAVTTINPGEKYTTVLPNGTFTGSISLIDGKLRGKGDHTLHERDGKRTLVYTSDDGRVGGEMTSAK